MIGFFLGILVILGVLTYPKFTLGVILIYFGHPVVGILVLLLSLLSDD